MQPFKCLKLKKCQQYLSVWWAGYGKDYYSWWSVCFDFARVKLSDCGLDNECCWNRLRNGTYWFLQLCSSSLGCSVIPTYFGKNFTCGWCNGKQSDCNSRGWSFEQSDQTPGSGPKVENRKVKAKDRFRKGPEAGQSKRKWLRFCRGLPQADAKKKASKKKKFSETNLLLTLQHKILYFTMLLC